MKNVQPINNGNNEDIGKQAALDLIKERIRELYGDNTSEEQTGQRVSLVDRFWQQHRNHPNPQAAWQIFYEGLSNHEKQELWREYHSGAGDKSGAALPKPHLNQSGEPLYHAAHSQTIDAQVPPATEFNVAQEEAGAAQHTAVNFEKPTSKKIQSIASKETLVSTKKKLIANIRKGERRETASTPVHKKRSRAHHWKPFFYSIIVMLMVLFAQYNPLIIALVKQYISPGDTLRSPVIVDPNVSIDIGQDARIIIPKINVDVPVVYSLDTRDEIAIQNALEDGVVHYAGSSKPGQAGNNVIVGHSSNNFLNSGKYKFAFVLLNRLELNDTFILHFKGKRYVYKVTNKQIIEPNDFSLIGQTKTPTATLITCDPPGTSWRRLVIQGEQISPAPTKAQTDETKIPASNVETPEDAIVPGNSPSLFQRFKNWLL